MKKFTTAILILLMGATSALSVQKPAEWIRHVSSEGRYSVLMPAAPTVGTQESTTPEGTKFTQYKATLGDASGVYLVGYFDHVPGTTFLLEKARDGMIEAIKGTLLNDSAISLEDSPGRELRIAATADGIEFLLRAKFYYVGKRVYVLQFIVPKSSDNATAAANATRFFDSFQLTKAK